LGENAGMNGHPEVIELLNEVLTGELTSINQYFVDAKMLDNWGYERLGKHYYDESIDEMKDADALIERILYLDGHPNLQRLGHVSIGESPLEKFQLSLQLETESVERLNRGIALSVTHGDNGTRELLEHILEGEEEHIDWLETQQSVVAQIGEANYLTQQLHE
jgi:bacterioferritin